MTTAETSAVAEVVQRVRSWPAPLRITLARQILETLETLPQAQPPSPGRGLSAEEVMALFRPVAPPPSDEECERVLEEELSKKYAR
jgi:hypothetical protein